MNTVRALTLGTLALLLAFPALGAGPEPGDHHRGDRGFPHPDGDPSDAIMHMMMRAVHQLDLSDAQEAAIRSIMESTHDDMEAAGKAAADNRRALHEALTSDSLDEEALATAAAKAGDLVAERIVIAAHAARAVMDELTEAQRAELQSMREEHMTKLRARRHAGDDA